ncbi:MAG: DUF1186 domain-containing protein [Alphaproteobacteria bacterium]|nr:DUF1186 domain-containing protein [Alphaproteobacteria bacterium]
MANEAPDDLPAIDIGIDIDQLRTERILPKASVVRCTAYYPLSGPFLRAALERAADGELIDHDDERLFFRALFIIGGRRDPLGFEPLLRFLRRPKEEVELLGDVTTEILPKILVGTYDGNVDGLFDAIADQRLGEYIRDALLGAAAFLTWEGRIDRGLFVGFLQRFGAERLAPDEDMAWIGWTMAIGLLGLRDMEPAVMAAWDRGAIPDHVMERRHFAEDLARAEREPDDIGRFEADRCGYIKDVLTELKRWPDEKDEEEEGAWTKKDEAVAAVRKELQARMPAFNPMRGVGRNDPCPCGSGKKAKRCCLAA